MEKEEPTRLEKFVDVLAKLVLVLWGVGLATLIVNAALVHQHRISLIGVRTLLDGFAVAFVIVAAVIGSVIVRRIRTSVKPD